MIGDNPESDIRGAMNYKSDEGTERFGILVATGVWDDKTPPSVEPSYYVADIREAVELIGKLEGMDLGVPVGNTTAGRLMKRPGSQSGSPSGPQPGS